MSRRDRSGWRYVGQERPAFAVVPGEGQESVWDYPRPPRIESDPRVVIVRVGETEVARSRRSYRVLETASPPTFYLPPQDVQPGALEAAAGGSMCEWKGQARYWTLIVAGQRVDSASWSYPNPLPGFEALRDYVSFYPARVQCSVDGARVTPQPGRFYGGWITSEVVGPFKGEAGSETW